MTGLLLALNILFTASSDIAFAVLAGCLLARLWLEGSTSASLATHLRTPARRAAVALLASYLTRPLFLAAGMTGATAVGVILAALPDVLFATHAGKLWLLGTIPVVALLLRTNSFLTACALLLLASTRAASGHAADAGDFTLSEACMLLHLLAVAVWAGGILVSGFLLLPRLARDPQPELLRRYGLRLSRTVTWALACILLSGAYTSYSEWSGPLTELPKIPWGRILLGKLFLVVLTLILGAVTRFRCLSPTAKPATLRRMSPLVRTEGVSMLLILILSAALANTSPVAGHKSSKIIFAP